MTGRVRRGTLEDVRRHNLASLVGHLHVRGPMRRADLTELTGLNRSTVAALVAELAGLGLVRETAGPADGRAAGRPSPEVSVRTDAVQVLAATVGVGRVEVALVGLGGAVLGRLASTGSASTPGAVTGLLVTAARQLLADPLAAPLVLGLGVAVPGVVRGQDGFVRFAPNLGWTDVALGERLAGRLGDLPVRLANDGDLGALVEHRRGVARGVDDLVFLVGESGVGGGVILGGRPLVGAGGYAGELGHMTIRPGGRRCRCGSVGCWETEIGGSAVRRALGLEGPGDPGDAGLVAALTDLAPGDPRLAGLAEVAEYLGIGLANVVNLLNPRLVVLGGLLSYLYPPLAERVLAAMGAAALDAPAEQVRLVLPGLGDDALLLGAAELAWEDLLADPVGTLRGDGGDALRTHVR